MLGLLFVCLLAGNVLFTTMAGCTDKTIDGQLCCSRAV